APNPNFRMSLAGSVVDPLAKVWHGGLGNDWDALSLNWNEGEAAYEDGFRVVFDDTALSESPATITLSASHEPLSIRVNNSVIDYLFTGAPIAGDTGLIKENTGTLTLLSPNEYSGDTVVAGGRLRIGDEAALGDGTLNLA